MFRPTQAAASMTAPWDPRPKHRGDVRRRPEVVCVLHEAGPHPCAPLGTDGTRGQNHRLAAGTTAAQPAARLSHQDACQDRSIRLWSGHTSGERNGPPFSTCAVYETSSAGLAMHPFM